MPRCSLAMASFAGALLALTGASLPRTVSAAGCGACLFWDPTLGTCRPLPYACGGVAGRGNVWDCGDCAGFVWDNELGHCERVGPDVCGRADVASVPPEEFGGDTPPYERGSVLFWRYQWWERSAYALAQAELARAAGRGGGGDGGQATTTATGFSCEMQAAWGKCGEAWMVGKCNKSCGRCGGGDGGCTDEAP